ncbi:MAG: AbgT family transporter, partial [Opitutales bacterium]|nr:AbgT family transporter [Opitutales bacterium]
MSSTPIDSRRGFLSTFLNWVEKAGNRLPDPLILYFGLAMLIPVLSWLISFIGWSRVHPVTGETIGLINLLTSEQIQRIFVEAENNFTSFPPLGAVLVTMLGIGVAERSGLIGTSLKLLVEATPRSLISVVVVFAGVMSSMAADAGYVVLTPLGAVLFAGMGRHPLAGLCAAFAGTGGGFSANLLLTSLDPLLSGFTQSAAQLYDPERAVTADANYFFM